MEISEIKSKVIKIISNLFPNSDIDSEVLDYVDLIDDLGMDSITFISIVIEVESTFDTVVPDEMLLMENFRNVYEILEVIKYAMNAEESLEMGRRIKYDKDRSNA